MNIPDHLQQTGIDQLPIDYKWDVRVGNKFMGANAESKPKLAEAIRGISDKAAFGLSIAAAEWVVTRLSRQTEVSDNLQRIEAAWAAMLDPRYADMAEADDPDTDDELPVTGPVWTATTMMGDAFEYGIAANDNAPIFSAAIGLCMLAEHVCGRSPAFKAWLPETLARLQREHPATDDEVEDQAPVGMEFFRPAGTPPLLETLLPGGNPYLRSADELRAEGISDPYPAQP